MFKNLVLLATALLATKVVANVSVYTDDNCSTGGTVVDTVSGTCYEASGSAFHSAKGCSSGHELRIHRTTDCSDNEGNFIDECAALPEDGPIGSFKCVLI